MKAHLRYLSYVIRHKTFVFWAGLRYYHVPLHQLIVHDWHKFLPSEWFPYANQFYRQGPSTDSKTGYRHDPAQAKIEFNIAWKKHSNRGPHHWEHWLMLKRDLSLKPLPMPDRFIREMVADWAGAGRAQDVGWNPAAWYAKNRPTMLLHPDVQRRVDGLLGVEPAEHIVLRDRVLTG